MCVHVQHVGSMYVQHESMCTCLMWSARVCLGGMWMCVRCIGALLHIGEMACTVVIKRNSVNKFLDRATPREVSP